MGEWKIDRKSTLEIIADGIAAARSVNKPLDKAKERAKRIIEGIECRRQIKGEVLSPIFAILSNSTREGGRSARGIWSFIIVRISSLITLIISLDVKSTSE